MRDVRASDADRQETQRVLQAHYAAGRLRVDELERRLSRAVGADMLSELDAVTADLPEDPAAARDRTAANPVEVGGWGVREFRQEHRLPATRDVVWRQVMAHIAPAMAGYGYSIAEKHPPELLVFELTERRLWPFFVIGPLGLLARGQPTRIAVSIVEQEPAGTRLIVTGVARRGVRKAFASISSD